MKLSLSLRCSLPLLVATVAFVGSILPVYGQVTTPCTASMISSISPCMMNLITNSSANGTSPTADCCNALKSLTSTGMDCACLIVTGNVPFQIPINRSLAISLPRACNMPGVPLQCKSTAAPIPAPGPPSFGAPPAASPAATVVPDPTPSATAPESDTTPVLTPPSTAVDPKAPTLTPGSRSVVTPSSVAMPSYNFSPSLLLLAVALLVMKYY
ncbi:non-specific lipid transfer protein GPI-anchored 20-like [Mangifera indica]|uniref:non-specific lipid transfer protein GPI-anchored 20-like n=1 Tax=Mangifera indica TaxID=29780 RepID=UPI001CFA673B|nr:non-specific lipid transfer protein GPI-anchored 20-like [Mangifera indica]